MAPYEFYDYSYMEPAIGSAAGSAAAGVLGFFAVFFGIFYLIMLAFSVAKYVLHALGLYVVAKRRGIRNPWLSWIPIAEVWILGSLSDQYQYVKKGKIRNRRKVLLGLNIGMCLAIIPLLISIVGAALSEATGSMNSDAAFGVMLATMLLTYLAIIVLGIILLIFEYIALYDLYASCNPDNAVLYLVLTIFLGVVLPFFVFICRKKDGGMPPRKTEEQLQPILQTICESAEPVEEEMPLESQPEEIPVDVQPEE
jgi:hypothetical protein